MYFCYKRRPPVRNAIEKMAYFSNRLMKSSTRNDVNKQNFAAGAKTTFFGLVAIVRGCRWCGAPSLLSKIVWVRRRKCRTFADLAMSSDEIVLRCTRIEKNCANLRHLGQRLPDKYCCDALCHDTVICLSLLARPVKAVS